MEQRRDQQSNKPRQTQRGGDQARQPEQAQGGTRQPQQGQGDMSQRAPNAGPQQGQNDTGRNPRQAQGGQQAEIGRAAQAQNITGESNLAGQSRQQGGAGGGMRQQQQFEQGSRQPSGGGEGRFADQIREHMEVIGPDGSHVGTVDHLEGDRIKLTKASSGTGEHSYLPCSLVAGIEGNRIRLRERGDTDFGMEADR